MADRRIQRVIEVLETRWNEPLRVTELARDAGLGVSRLQMLFKAHARRSIRTFLKDRRLENAAEMIRESDERISQIAYAVGFRDVPNFNHAFKERFGMSPRRYRELAGARNGLRAAMTPEASTSPR
jgi:transcriptional regulator GlxA family with amidase domain